MDFIRRKLFGKVDDYYGVKWAFLYTYSAARAQVFGNEGLIIFRPLDNAGAACLVYWAVDDALEPAFPRLAQVFIKYRYAMCIFCFRIAQLHVNFALLHYIAIP